MDESTFARSTRSRLHTNQGDKYVPPTTDNNTIQKILLKGYLQNCQTTRELQGLNFMHFMVAKDITMYQETVIGGCHNNDI